MKRSGINEDRNEMKWEQAAFLPILLVSVILSLAPAKAADIEGRYVYVAPNVIQARGLNVFTTLALTNTTVYWFNPRIFLVNPEGEVVRQFAPLVKSFGSWQKSSVDFLEDDFSGSVWIVSPQPIVSTAFIHQLAEDGSVSLLGNARLERVGSSTTEALTEGSD